MIGAHSVIERPEPVMRVSPPMVTMARMIRAMARSHTPTALREARMPVPIHIVPAKVHSCGRRHLRRWSGHDPAHKKADRRYPDAGLAGVLCAGCHRLGGPHPAARGLVCEPAFLCRFGRLLDRSHRAGPALDVCGAETMID